MILEELFQWDVLLVASFISSEECGILQNEKGFMVGKILINISNYVCFVNIE
jgi:hypothetical protein